MALNDNDRDVLRGFIVLIGIMLFGFASYVLFNITDDIIQALERSLGD